MDVWTDYFRKREIQIRRRYLKLCKARVPNGEKSSKLVADIPYFRPTNQLKQLTYRFALEVSDKGGLEELAKYVEARDKNLPPYRGDGYLSLWALRLVSPKAELPKKRKSRKGPKFLQRVEPTHVLGKYGISSSQISKFGQELQLAYSLNIDWRNLTFFISAIGGYDYINEQRIPNNLESMTWVKRLMRRPNP